MIATNEQIVLSIGLLDPWKAFGKAREMLTVDDFIDPMCREVWRAMCAASDAGLPPDPSITTHFIMRHVSPTERSQAIVTLARSLCDASPTILHAEYYARLVIEARCERETEDLSSILASRPSQDDIDRAMRALSNQRDRLELISDTQKQATSGLLQDLVVDWLERITSEVREAGIPTASPTLDRHIGGPLPLGAYVVLGAAPSNGKTLFMLQMLYNAAKAGHKCVLYSQEMAADAICERVVATITGHSRDKIGKWNRGDIATEVMRWFSESSAITFRRCDSRVGSIVADMKYQAKHGVTVFAVDYLGMLKSPGHKSGYEEVSACTNELKAITTQLNVTTIVGCQLNKEGMKDKPPIPQKHHLKDSSAMFENADAVLMLRYPKTDTEPHELAKGLADANIKCEPQEYFEVYVRKLRNRELPQAACGLRLTRDPLRLVPIYDEVVSDRRSEVLDDWNNEPF